jgi:hypothetical protein
MVTASSVYHTYNELSDVSSRSQSTTPSSTPTNNQPPLNFHNRDLQNPAHPNHPNSQINMRTYDEEQSVQRVLLADIYARHPKTNRFARAGTFSFLLFIPASHDSTRCDKIAALTLPSS